MTRLPLPWHTALALGGISLILAGCAAMPPIAPVSEPFDLHDPVLSGGIRVRLADAGRTVQTVPNTWSSAQFTLNSPSVLTADRTETIQKTSFNDTGAGTPASTTVTLFASARAGSYTLFASTYNNGVRNALGSVPVTLVAGSQTGASITLRTLPEWTAGDVAATVGNVSSPKGLTFGGDGSMYVCDPGNKRVAKLDAGMTTLTTLVGDGTDATLNNPSALAYDAANDMLFIADTANHRVRRVSDPDSGAVLEADIDLTSLGASVQPLALAYDPSRDALYVALADNRVVQVGTPSGTPGAPAVLLDVGAGLSSPQGLAIDATGIYLYVSDTGNRKIRRVTLADSTVTLLAGNGTDAYAGDGALAASASFKVPAGLAYESTDGGRLYVLDSGASVVRAITLANGMIATVFGNGTSANAGNGQGAQQASLYAPSGLGLSGTGKLYVSESGGTTHRIRSAQ